MSVWDITDSVLPGVEVTERKARPVTLRSVISSGLQVVVIATTVLGGASATFQVTQQSVNLSPEASGKLKVVTVPKPPLAQRENKKRVEGIEDTSVTVPSLHLAGVFKAMFRPAPPEDPIDEDVSSK